MTVTVSQSYGNMGGGTATNGGNPFHYGRYSLMAGTTNAASYNGNPQSPLNGDNHFQPNNWAAGEYYQIQLLGKKRIITAVKIVKNAATMGGIAFDLFGSQDGATWSSSLGNIVFTTATTETLNASGNSTAYSYYKIQPRSNTGASLDIQQIDFEISGNQYEFGDRKTGSLVLATSSFSASGGGMSSSMDGDFAQDSTHAWWRGGSCVGEWIQFVFADPVVLLNIVGFDSGSSGSNGTWKIQQDILNNGTWTDLSTAKQYDMSTVSGRVFPVTGAVAATKYRMLGTAGNMDSGPYYFEWGFDIDDGPPPAVTQANLASMPVEVASSGVQSNAVLTSAGVEVLSSGVVGNARLSSFAVEVLSTVQLAPTQAFDGTKIYEFLFSFQPETQYNESDWDSIYSVGDRVGNGTMSMTDEGWPDTFGTHAFDLGDDYFNNSFVASGGSTWPGGAFIGWQILDGSYQLLSGIRFFSGDGDPWPGQYYNYAGYDGVVWTLNTFEFDTFVIGEFVTDPRYTGTKTIALQFTPPSIPFNYWSITLSSIPDHDDEHFPSTFFSSELMFKIYHSVLDGGDRRDDNLREIKRISITASAGIAPSLSGAPTSTDPLKAMIDGVYKHDNANFGKSEGTFLKKTGASTGSDQLDVPGEYIQFNFHRKVAMRESVWNVDAAESVDSGGDPLYYGKWQWQASNAPGSGYSNVGAPFQFGINSRWMKSPRPFASDADYASYLFPYWRMVLVEGPAFGSSSGQRVFQIQFNLIDPDNQSVPFEAPFSDSSDDNFLATMTVTTGSPSKLDFTDSSDDKLSATLTVVNNPLLTASFSDGDSDALLTRASFEPSIFVQTIAIVKGR